MQALTELLALNAPRVPAAVGNGGLNWQNLNDPDAPVQVQVVLSPNTIFINDRLDLYWQGAFVTSETVNQDHLKVGLVTLSVKPADILRYDDGLHTLHYIAYAAIGGGESPSEPGTVKVKRLVPGGYDPEPGSPYINENLKAPTGIPAFIDDDIANQGVIAQIAVYEHMSVGDRLTLDWGGQPMHRAPLEPIDIGQVISIPIPHDILANSAGRQVVVRYSIRDEVNNWSKWSLATHTEVEVGDDLLLAPRLMDAPAGIIDLALLGDKDARVQTPVYIERMDPGDRVRLTWAGQTAEGIAVPVIKEKEVLPENIGWPLDFEIDNAKVKAIAQGFTVVSYEVFPKVGQPRRSRRARADVIGQVLRLPAPDVEGAVGDVLDPALLPAAGAQVTLAKNDLFKAGDTVVLYWDGVTETGTLLPYQVTIPITGSAEGQPIIRTVPLDKITPLQGGTVQVHYLLTKADGATFPSDPRALQVKSIGAQLPKPTVDFAVDDQLDPANVPSEGTTVRVNYSPMQSGDRIDMHWDGVVDYTDYFPVPTNWNNKEVPFPVAKSYVTTNLNETVNAFYTVTRSGQLLPPSHKQPLRIGAGISLLKPSVKEATNTSLDPIAAKDALTVVIPANSALQPDDKVIVTWAGNGSEGSHTTPARTISQGLEIAVPNSVVAFNLGKNVAVSYTITRGTGLPIVSPVFDLAVLPIPAESGQLPSPKITQAIANVLDLSTFAGNPVITVIPWPLIAAGQHVWLRCYGTNADNTPRTITLWVGSAVTAGEVTAGLSKPIPRDQLELLKDSTELRVELKVTFDRTNIEANALTFPVARFTVKTALQLAAPTVKEATNTTSLNPLAAKDALTVVVPPGDLLPDDSLTATWTGTPGEGSYTSPAQLVRAGLDIAMNKNVVAFNLNKAVSVTYTVTRNGVAQTSAALTLNVQKIPDQDGALPKPAIDGAVGDVLDVPGLTGNELLRVATWPLQVSGQRVWLRYDGIDIDDKPTQEVVWAGATHAPTNGATVQVPIAWLDTLKDGSSLTITFKVNFAKENNEETAVMFPARVYAIQQGLIADPSPLTLGGLNFTTRGTGLPWTRAYDPEDTFAQRPAWGGTPPYNYSSSDPLIASVDAKGTVRSEGNGSATITVTDSSNPPRRVTYPVTARNVRQIILSPTTFSTLHQFTTWVTTINGEYIDLYHLPTNFIMGRLFNITDTTTQFYILTNRINGYTIYLYQATVIPFFLTTRAQSSSGNLINQRGICLARP